MGNGLRAALRWLLLPLLFFYSSLFIYSCPFAHVVDGGMDDGGVALALWLLATWPMLDCDVMRLREY
jgi:hypothetical protein